MKLEIKLKDKKKCEGCPCLQEGYCNYYNIFLTVSKYKVNRSIVCIKENGE